MKPTQTLKRAKAIAPRWLAVLFVGTLLPAPSLAIDPGWAKGTLTTARGEVALTHAYAMEHLDEEGVADGPELRILLSEHEVSETLLSGPFLTALERQVREQGLRGVLLRLDPKRLAAAPVHGTLLEAPADPQQSLRFFTLGGDAVGLDNLRVDPTRVTGHARHAPVAGASADFAYDVTFSAPRFTDVVRERLTGAKARDSAPVKALLAWERAVRAGDLDAAKAYATPGQMARLEAYRAAVGAEAFRREVGAGIPDQRQRERQIKEVLVRGDRASVVVQEKGARSVSVLVRQDGAWKVD